MNGLLQDVRFALRGFRRSPGFAAVAIATLALGIGANTAVFSVVDGVLLRPLRFPHPERLVSLAEIDESGSPGNVGWATYADWRRQSKSFDDVAVASYWNPTLTGGSPGRAPGARRRVRIALGATAARIRTSVMRDAIAQTLAGLAVGAAGAVASARILRSQLFGLSALDPLVLGGAAAVLLSAAALAAWLPARRASSVDPMTALRTD